MFSWFAAALLSFNLIWCFSERLWFSPGENRISVAEGRFSGEYRLLKNIWGDYLLLHFDHGNQYLISPRYNQINIISESKDHFYFGGVITYEPWASMTASNEKIILPAPFFPNPQLKITSNTIEFYGNEWENNSQHGELWTIKR